MYLHIVELLSKRSSTFALTRREFQTPDNTQRITNVSFSSHQPPHLSLQPQLLRSGRCRRQKGALRVRRGRRRRQCEGVDDDDGGRARMTWETSLPPPSLGFSQGPPSRRGRKAAEEEEEAPLAPPAGCRDALRHAAATSCPLGAPPPLVR
jgi:hypothetical protein